jgi:uncharacterized protein (TIGR04255 family)
MGEYLPCRVDNSIQEAHINLIFPNQFDRNAIEAALSFTKAALTEDFPQASEVRGGSLRIDITNPPQQVPPTSVTTGLIGFQFSKIQLNGQPARILSLTNNVLSVSFMDYEGWPTVRQNIERYLTPAVARLPLIDNPVMGYSLRFIDRYNYHGDQAEADAKQLFRNGSPYIAPQIFEAGATWHCNTGWFDTSIGSSGGRILHNVNIASRPLDMTSAITLDHNATVQLEIPRNSNDALFAPDPEEALRLLDTLDVLHDQNKNVLREALLPEMLGKIGLA